MENANVVNSDLDKVSNSNGQGLKVFIMNRYPSLTSVYRWSQDLSSMLGSIAVQINLIFDNKGWSRPHDGIDFKGRFMKIPSLHHFLRNISYRDAIKYINNERKMGQKVILHYTNQFSGTLKINNVEEIINIQDSPFYLENSSQFERIYIRRLYETLKHKNHIITNTSALKEELQEFGFDGDIETVHLPYSQNFRKLPVAKETLRKKLNLPVDKVLILSVSTDSPRKNLQMVHKVIIELGDRYRLVRVGKPLGDSITFSNIDDESLNEVYNACDILLFPSLYEGFGLPIAEAFATGLPVVTSDIPTIREVAGNAAILINPKDSISIKNGVTEALGNSESLIQNGLVRASKFSVETFRSNILNLYGKWSP
jgi:glycosyltransferase involved in cell wall biosynthesis